MHVCKEIRQGATLVKIVCRTIGVAAHAPRAVAGGSALQRVVVATIGRAVERPPPELSQARSP